MHEFGIIATQSKRRGGNICYSCFKQLIRREYSNSNSKILNRSKTLSQAFVQSLEQRKEWKPRPRPILAPFSSVTQSLASGQPPKPKVHSKVQHSPNSQNVSKLRIFRGYILCEGGQQVIPSASSTSPVHNEKTLHHPRIRRVAFDGEPLIQSSSRLQCDDQESVSANRNGEYQSEERSSRLRIRLHTALTSEEQSSWPSVKANTNNPLRRSTTPTHARGSALRLYSTSARVQAAAATVYTSGDNQSPSSAVNITIHDKLRQFQKTLDNANAKDRAALELALSNITISTNASVLEIVDEEEDHDPEDQEELDLDESITNFRPLLEPGDLIELGTNPDSPLAVVTAVFAVGPARHIQFVTSNSTWEHRRFSLRQQPTFAIRRFFKMSELAGVKRHLPKGYLSTMGFGQKQNNQGILPAEISCSVIEKMQMFQNDADEVYQQHASNIDNAFESLSKPDQTIVISLEEITRKVLNISKSITIRNETLYAVHKACALYNFGFLLDRFHWHSRKFELLSKKEAEVIEQIRKWTRQHSEHMVSQLDGQRSSNKSVLDMFANEIRPIILKSRESRKSLAGGHLGSSKLQLDEMQEGTMSYKSVLDRKISSNGATIFEFLKLFADRTFNYRDRGLLQGFASVILKSTGLHGDDNVFNNHAPTSLLKECGILSPWQAPNYAGGRWSDPYQGDHAPGSKLLTEAQEETKSDKLENDIMRELRHDFGDMPVYCIDSDSTIDVDDGMSLEKTSEQGIYWIHVHIANPTAFISQFSKVSQLAQVSRTSIYLPDRVNRMLPLNLIRERLSLQAGCPTLTISTKVNMDGMVLDRQIRNGTINNVMRITPEMLPAYNDDTLFPHTLHNFVVGHFPVSSIQNKRTKSPLSAETIDELQIMKRLGDAWTAREAKARNSKWFFKGSRRPLIKVYHEKVQDVSPNHFRQFIGDPTISFSVSSWDPHSSYPIAQKQHRELVESIMVLANNSAAEWCAQRGIPALFRGCTFETRNNFNAGTAQPFQNSGNIATDFQEFCRRHSNLQIDTKKEMSIRKLAHEVIGVDAYITVTSPLRRYDDMVNHWQIEAALREEAKLGRPIVEHDFCRFPFSEDMMKKEIVKSIDISHINMRRSSYITAHWKTEFLIRGVLFEECKDLPRNFTFYVISAVEDRLYGIIAELAEATSVHLLQVSAASTLPEVGQIWKVKSHEEILGYTDIKWQLVERVA